MNQPEDKHAKCPSIIDVDYTRLDYLAFGRCGIVYAMDDQRVLKEYHGEEQDAKVERQAFARLGIHDNIVRYLGSTANGSAAILERGQHLRTIISQIHPDQYSLRTKLQWIKDAAEGLRHIHRSGIVHADFGCNNMILVENRVKIIDFEGCGIDNQQATACYAWYSWKPFSPGELSRRTDIFAFGCAIYEILTGKPPYHELKLTIHKDELAKYVQILFAKNDFPNIQDIPLGEVIKGCWHNSFESMDEVIRVIAKASFQFENPPNVFQAIRASTYNRLHARFPELGFLFWQRNMFDIISSYWKR